MATAEPTVRLAPRHLAWARRRRAFATHWATFRRNRQGMLGLGILGGLPADRGALGRCS